MLTTDYWSLEMKVLLHICCGPCAIYPVQALSEAGHDVHGYFYNPNIHPFQELKRRVAALEAYLQHHPLPMVWDLSYELENFLRQVVFREAERCRICYRLRLAATARQAAALGADAFTSTLLYSKYQNHELIAQLAEQAAHETGVPFYYEDFRRGWAQGVAASKEMGLYRQPYCGCIFSERDRYYRPPNPIDSGGPP